MILDSEDFILRPIDEGMCRYESAIDGTLTLLDFARMNDYLDRKAHNSNV